MSQESPFVQRIVNSNQISIFEKIRSKMEKAAIQHPDDIAELKYQRILKGLIRVQENLGNLDLDLLEPRFLGTLHSHFKAIYSEIAAYTKNPGVQHLDNANSHLDNAAQAYPFLFVSNKPESSEEFKSLLDSYHEASRSYIKSMEQTRDGFGKIVHETKAEAVELKKGLEQQKEALSKLRQENAAISSQQNETFLKSQQERDDEFKTLKETVMETVDGVIKEKEELFTARLSDFETQANERVEKIQSMLDDARKTFQNLGVVVQTGKYQEFADKEGKVASGLRWGAIISLVLMFSGTLWVIISAEREQLPWNLFLLRFLTVAALSIPAYYFARESTRHREKEHHYRKIQLELTSLTPFIEFFDDAKKREIKEKLVEKYFGREEADKVNDEQILTKKDLMEILAKLPTG